MAAQDRLDLGRVRVEAPDHVHVLDPVGDGDVAGLVHHADVARVQPAVRVDRLGGRPLVTPVPRHHRVAADDDLPGLTGTCGPSGRDGTHLEPRDGAARGRRHDPGGVATTAHGDRAAGLGQPVRGQHRGEAELRAHGLDQLHGHDGGARDAEPERREVAVGPPRVGQQGLVQGRGAGQHGDPLRLNALHHPTGVEDGLGDHRGPRHEAGQDAGLVAEGVEERVHHQVAVPRVEPDDGGPGAEGAQRLRVRGRRSFGVAGRPGGEDEVGHVVGFHRRGAGRGHRGVDAIACFEEFAQPDHRRRCPPRPSLLVAQQDDSFERADVLAVEEDRVVGAQEAPHREQQGGAGRAHDVPRLAPLEARVERDEHGAGPQRAEGPQHPFGAVRRPERDAVPRLHTGRHEAAGVAVDLGAQPLVGQAHPDVDQRLGAGVAPAGVVDQPRDRPPGQVGAGVLVPRRRAADTAHGCWLLTETTSPLRYDE